MAFMNMVLMEVADNLECKCVISGGLIPSRCIASISTFPRRPPV